MQIARERAATTSAEGASLELLEIVTPRTNAATITPAEHLFAALVRERAVSLEIAGDHLARRFYARLAGPASRQQIVNQISAAYPQACLRPATAPDPAHRQADEQAAVVSLGLRAPEYLPLRIPRDGEMVADRAAQADPLLAVLAALGGLPLGWRALIQLVLEPAPDGWARPYLRRSIEHALAPERATAQGGSPGTGLLGLMPVLLLLVAVTVGPRLLALYQAGAWLPIIFAALGLVGVVGVGAWVWRRLSNRPLYDQDLVREKVSWPAARTELRLIVFAPATAAPAELQAHLDQLAAAYRAYDLERGNGLVARPLLLPVATRGPDAFSTPSPLGRRARLATLTTRELAGLWHLVQAGDDVALVERTTARRFLPLPETVADGARIGVAEHQGRTVPVHLSPTLLRRHDLLVGKSRKGKSVLLGARWQQLVSLPDAPGAPRPAVILVDPHSDLATAALGLVPPQRHADVVCLDVGRARERPFGLNLLDVGLGWDRDRLVENALLVFQHQFDQFWGPRMELVFRFALLLLIDMNEQLCREDPTGGRDRQYTILEVPRVLEDDAFRQALVRLASDRQQQAWWASFFDPLDRRFRLEVINPVQSKTYKIAANRTARAILGQSRSTIDPGAWVRDGAIVVVDLAKEVVSADIAALLGGALVNLTALAIGRQATLPRHQRRHVALLVDEFHTLPAADYASILAELAKYGASLTLATQTLGALASFDRDGELRARVFGNVDHLYAFNCSADDARVLVPELGAPLEVADLVELGDYQCYARLGHEHERLPAFHLRLDPPTASDPVVGSLLADRSRRQYGREPTRVTADRDALLERIASMSQPHIVDTDEGGRSRSDPGNGRLPPASTGSLTGPPPQPRRRNQGRASSRARRPPVEPAGLHLVQTGASDAGSTDESAESGEPEP